VIRVEEGSAEDVDAAMAVMIDAFDPTFGEAWTRSQLLSGLSIANTRLLVSRFEDIVIGFALTRTIIDETELLMIGVQRQWQGKAIASKLVQQIIEFESAKQRQRIFLEVRSSNHARQFYEKIGFSEIGRRTNYYRGSNGDKFDAITMAYLLVE
jgi:[ribosomal protein S18]-alanine N-acetyltransferase